MVKKLFVILLTALSLSSFAQNQIKRTRRENL